MFKSFKKKTYIKFHNIHNIIINNKNKFFEYLIHFNIINIAMTL